MDTTPKTTTLTRLANPTALQHILVPTDFSDCARNALQVASDLARKSSGTIHLVHTYETPIAGMALEFSVNHKEHRELRKGLVDKMGELAREPFLKDINVRQYLIADKQLWQVLKSAGLHETDTIVMGSHGSKGAREFFIGSNAQKIVQMAEVPVLVVKDYFNATDVTDVVFASNFYGESLPGFGPIRELAELLGATLHLLKIVTPANFENSDRTQRVIRDFAEAAGLTNYTINVFNDKSIERGILAFAGQVNANLIAMETHGKKGLAHLISGNITEHVVNHSELPVMSTRIEKVKSKTGKVFPETH